jgi:hypothetical protein
MKLPIMSLRPYKAEFQLHPQRGFINFIFRCNLYLVFASEGNYLWHFPENGRKPAATSDVFPADQI